MANNCKQCFNTHYQPHCHPTTKSLWLCSSVYCGPPHPSRRIMVGGRSRQPKTISQVQCFKLFLFCRIITILLTCWISYTWLVDILNTLCPSDAIWWHRYRSTLVQVVARCLTAPTHYLNQCLLIDNRALSNKLWSWNHNTNISFQKIHLKVLSAKQ